uniref:Uncharacterized protein n=1 Tax=Vitis vinifera TaxID=29760 RepID=A5C8E1_VITVI|nr:hypothetical protein VITISV_017251 [Vitis vinifera]
MFKCKKPSLQDWNISYVVKTTLMILKSKIYPECKAHVFLIVKMLNVKREFGDLDIKYLKQNISKCRSQISGSFRRTPLHCAKWLQNSPGKRYQRIRICLTGEVETPSSPIRRQAPDVKYPDGMSAEKNSGCETSGWNVGRAEFRM